MSKRVRNLLFICGVLHFVLVAQAAWAGAISLQLVATSLDFASTGDPVPGFVPHLVGSLFLDNSAVVRGSVNYSATNDDPFHGPSRHLPSSATPISYSI